MQRLCLLQTYLIGDKYFNAEFDAFLERAPIEMYRHRNFPELFLMRRLYTNPKHRLTFFQVNQMQEGSQLRHLHPSTVTMRALCLARIHNEEQRQPKSKKGQGKKSIDLKEVRESMDVLLRHMVGEKIESVTMLKGLLMALTLVEDK